MDNEYKVLLAAEGAVPNDIHVHWVPCEYWIARQDGVKYTPFSDFTECCTGLGKGIVECSHASPLAGRQYWTAIIMTRLCVCPFVLVWHSDPPPSRQLFLVMKRDGYH